jgi:hypothetical protein
MTSSLTLPASLHRPGSGSTVTADWSRSVDRSGSSFTALTRNIHEMGLMRRRRGYYWAKLIGAVLILMPGSWVSSGSATAGGSSLTPECSRL